MLGDHHPVQADLAGVLDQLPGIDVAVRGMFRGMQMMVEFHEVGQLGAEGDDSRETTAGDWFS